MKLFQFLANVSASSSSSPSSTVTVSSESRKAQDAIEYERTRCLSLERKIVEINTQHQIERLRWRVDAQERLEQCTMLKKLVSFSTLDTASVTKQLSSPIIRAYIQSGKLVVPWMRPDSVSIGPALHPGMVCSRALEFMSMSDQMFGLDFLTPPPSVDVNGIELNIDSHTQWLSIRRSAYVPPSVTKISRIIVEYLMSSVEPYFPFIDSRNKIGCVNLDTEEHNDTFAKLEAQHMDSNGVWMATVSHKALCVTDLDTDHTVKIGRRNPALAVRVIGDDVVVYQSESIEIFSHHENEWTVSAFYLFSEKQETQSPVLVYRDSFLYCPTPWTMCSINVAKRVQTKLPHARMSDGAIVSMCVLPDGRLVHATATTINVWDLEWTGVAFSLALLGARVSCICAPVETPTSGANLVALFENSSTPTTKRTSRALVGLNVSSEVQVAWTQMCSANSTTRPFVLLDGRVALVTDSIGLQLVEPLCGLDMDLTF